MDKETQALEEAKAALKKAENRKQESLSIITGLRKEQCRIINKEFVSFECESIKDMAKVLTNIEPSTNETVINHKEKIYLTTPYKVSIENGVRRRELRIAFYNVGVLHWIQCPMVNLPDKFKDKYFHRSSRKVTSSEYHYFPGTGRAELNRMRIPCMEFNNLVHSIQSQVGFYGGDKVLTNETIIKELIKDICNAK